MRSVVFEPDFKPRSFDHAFVSAESDGCIGNRHSAASVEREVMRRSPRFAERGRGAALMPPRLPIARHGRESTVLGLRCPHCGLRDFRLVKILEVEEQRDKRRRHCRACGRRFWTIETVVAEP